MTTAWRALSWRTPLAFASTRRTAGACCSAAPAAVPASERAGVLVPRSTRPPPQGPCCPPCWPNPNPTQVCELAYSKATDRPARWVLAVPEDSNVQCAADLAGAPERPRA